MATQLQTPEPELAIQETEEHVELHRTDATGKPALTLPTPEKPSRFAMLKQYRKVLFVGLAVVVVVGGVLAWIYFSSYESTDDAQVDGHLHQVSARISGTIIRVNPAVEDSHYVEAGTVLAEIDPADYQADRDRAQADFARLQASSVAAEKDISVTSSGSNGRLDLANAAVNEAQDSVATEKASLQVAQARLAQAQANFTRAENDRQRYERLLAKREISQSEYDRVATESATDNEGVAAAKADLIAGQQRIAQAQSRLAERKADLLSAGSAPQQIASTRAKATAAVSEAARAHAQLTTSQLNLSYTKIIAPVSGIIGRKTVEEGQRVQPGQQLLTIIPVDDLWITANFKETQLQKMKPGQAVTIRADASGQEYHGHVDQLGGATGSKFSLLPAENATGNYVKVVQRVPVRIVLDQGQNADHRLRPGMSVEPKVQLR
ncbi:MAG TPA: HlyD family secretion protein [Candidatus Angelobacter sp.]|jgi:membrane fusion protein (multidrug efflux system)|nr:HlyD family secretion protein [Candidatus Angelobacter sp.]